MKQAGTNRSTNLLVPNYNGTSGHVAHGIVECGASGNGVTCTRYLVPGTGSSYYVVLQI